MNVAQLRALLDKLDPSMEVFVTSGPDPYDGPLVEGCIVPSVVGKDFMHHFPTWRIDLGAQMASGWDRSYDAHSALVICAWDES
jgi:hypothetical protein